MPRIRGKGLGYGMALGTAAIVQYINDVPVPPVMPDRISAQLASRRMGETPEIVLVARDYLSALSIIPSIRWAKVAAIATEAGIDSSPPVPVPTVVDVPGLMDLVRDDVLMLVDADAAFVFPDPDAMYLAQYTAEHDRLAPRHRIYLDDCHTNARTTDGTVIQVIARVRIENLKQDTLEAIEQGADAIFLPAFDENDLMAAQRSLLTLIHDAAGKPLLLGRTARNAAAYSPPLLVEVAVEADITVVQNVLPESPTVEIDTLLRRLRAAEQNSFDEDRPAALPHIAILMDSISADVPGPDGVEKFIEELSARGIARIVFSMENEALAEGVLLQLESYFGACSRNMIPLFVSAANTAFNPFGLTDLDDSLHTAIAMLVGGGATGVIVSPDSIAYAKAIVSQLNSLDCREKYHLLLKEAAAY